MSRYCPVVEVCQVVNITFVTLAREKGFMIADAKANILEPNNGDEY